jgi:hypothetical protein
MDASTLAVGARCPIFGARCRVIRASVPRLDVDAVLARQPLADVADRDPRAVGSCVQVDRVGVERPDAIPESARRIACTRSAAVVRFLGVTISTLELLGARTFGTHNRVRVVYRARI